MFHALQARFPPEPRIHAVEREASPPTLMTSHLRKCPRDSDFEPWIPESNSVGCKAPPIPLFICPAV